jgi:uncharacterized protein YjiK
MNIKNMLCVVLASMLICCAQETRKNKPANMGASRIGSYDFEHPQVFDMPVVLNEISGITFHNGNPDRLYAEQDEEGVLYSLKLGSKEVNKTKFHKKGDFEDVQILHDKVLVLRSDGAIFSFPFAETTGTKTGEVIVSEGMVPTGEYEAMFADQETAKVYVLCKSCGEKPRSSTSGFIFTIDDKGLFVPAGKFTINADGIAAKPGKKKMALEPSALGRNPVTREWFILSSVNKMLVIADANWAIKSVVKLDASLYNQPEGLAFDNKGNLYISNERGSLQSATVLKVSRR